MYGWSLCWLHWITLNEGAQEEAKELGVTVDFMSPNTKDDAQQIECVNNAVAGGYDAIMVAANGPDAISSALQEAKDLRILFPNLPNITHLQYATLRWHW